MKCVNKNLIYIIKRFLFLGLVEHLVSKGTAHAKALEIAREIMQQVGYIESFIVIFLFQHSHSDSFSFLGVKCVGPSSSEIGQGRRRPWY